MPEYNYPELQIDDIADLGKVHADKIDEIAEANDGMGMLQGWVSHRGDKLIDLVFEHAVITVNYQFELIANRMIYRVDEQDAGTVFGKSFRTYRHVKSRCISKGDHLKSCDDDGFCNYCGHQ